MKPQVRIRDRRRKVVVVALLGDGAAQPTGYTGWQAVSRPKRVPFADWVEGDALRMALPILLDGFREDRSVQRDFTRLENMARKRGQQRPPTIKLSGPVHHTDRVWVLEDLEWGDGYRNDNGVLVRQAATLQLMEWVAGDIVKSAAKRQRDRAGGGKRRVYTVKRGDTLSSIAAKQLGAAKRWREIAKLNKIRDPRSLKAGQKIRLPKADG